MASDEFARTTLGRTGITVGRLGISASYGVPTAAVEKAFEHGVNYLYWGSRRTSQFASALRNIAPKRDRFTLVVQSYTRIAGLMGWSLERALRKLRMDHADVLLLGMWNRPVSPRILEAAQRLKERGLTRFLAVSTHQRPLVPVIAAARDFDVVHFRYNAVHPGAETDIFPNLPRKDRPGLVSFTATSWRELLKSKRLPEGERAPTATDCYRFVLSRPEVSVCMTGPSKAEHVDAALEALTRGPMSAAELGWMHRIGKAIGGR